MQPAAPAQPDAKALEAEFWKNPLGMTQAIAARAVAEASAAVTPATDTLVNVAKEQARSRDPRIFDLLRAEIEAKVQGMPPQFHQSAAVWNNAFNMAVGENLDRVTAARATPPAAPAAAAAAPAGGPAMPSSRQPAPPPEEKLTDDEKEFIGKFGLSAESYRRGKQRYEAQGTGKPNTPSSWDEVITFDSDQAKAKRAAAKKGAAA